MMIGGSRSGQGWQVLGIGLVGSFERKADVRYTPKLIYTSENMLRINGANRVFVCIRAIIIVYYSMD